MFPPAMHDILMWIAIISLVILVAMTGMYINRFFIHRAHRRALAELHRRATAAEHYKRQTGVQEYKIKTGVQE